MIEATETERNQRLADIFFPHVSQEISQIQDKNILFSHYTSIESAEAIIKSNCFLLRNARRMNDYSEIQYGTQLIAKSLSNFVIFSRLSTALALIRPNLALEVIKTFLSEQEERLNNSYIISLSQHGRENRNENLYGRLSMWRAYASKDGVAFIFNTSALLGNSNAYNAYMSPCLYATQELFDIKFMDVVSNIENSIDFLRRIGADSVAGMLCRALHFAALSTKHPSFAEEQEWRIIYCPTHLPTGGQSPNIEAADLPFRGEAPQRVYKLRMENFPEAGFTGASFPEILNHMIIGPSRDPQSTHTRLALLLKNSGVENVDSKIIISAIPLRSDE